MKDLGVGVVGCGVISTIYMQNIASFRGVRLVACADILEHPARTQADKFGIRAASIDASWWSLNADRHGDVPVPRTGEAERRTKAPCKGAELQRVGTALQRRATDVRRISWMAARGMTRCRSTIWIPASLEAMGSTPRPSVA